MSETIYVVQSRNPISGVWHTVTSYSSSAAAVHARKLLAANNPGVRYRVNHSGKAAVFSTGGLASPEQ